MSNYQESRRDRYSDDKRHGDYKGRRESGGGYERPFQQTCFYCKEVGHKISDCPKKSNKNQRNGQNYKYNRNDSNQFSKRNQKEKDNFVYEDNCPPPEDEDWGGGTDSEEERKRLKKQLKKQKKLQQQLENQLEIQNEQNDNQKNIEQDNQDWQQQQADQNQQKENQNDFEEDWGGNDQQNAYVKQEHQNDNQINFEIPIEDQIKAQFGGSFAIHKSRNVESINDQKESNDLKSKQSYDQLEKSSDQKYEKNIDSIRNSSRERERERTRDYSREISHKQKSSYDKYNKQDDQKYKKDSDRSKRDYDKSRDDRRNSESDYRHKSDREKYHRSDRSYNQDKYKNNGQSEREPSLRDNSYRKKQEIISEEKFQSFVEKHQDEITNQISQMLSAQAQGLTTMQFFSKMEENEQENEKKDESYEEWTLESLQKDQEKQNSNSNRNKSYCKEYGNENYSSKNKLSYDDDWGISVENRYNRDEFNNSLKKSETNGYYNKYNNNYKNQYSSSQQKEQNAIVIISDDENDPWESPKRNQKAKLNKRSSSTYNKPSSQKKNLSNLVNNGSTLIEKSPVYELNLDYENQITIKNKEAILYNPDKENKDTIDQQKNLTAINNFNYLAIENIYDFEKQQQRELLPNCIKFYDNIPPESYKLGYDRYSPMFKDKLINFLYPINGNCLKVYEGDLKMKKYTEQGSLSLSIKAQVYTNHPWSEIKWIPSLKILRQKDKIKEFQSIDFSTGASQLSQMIPKDNYERIFYLYWIEGQNEEDEQKIEDYSNYLYEKKLLSGVNLETGCYTMASINQIFPEVESFMRNSDFKKKTPIKLVLIFNPELGYQVSYKSVPF
ncbi:hypothetical protein ABPG72_008098 [Tetrahymena utriculariae]